MGNDQRLLRTRGLSTSMLCLLFVSLLISSGFATARIMQWYAEGNPQRDMRTPRSNIRQLATFQEIFHEHNHRYARSNQELVEWLRGYYPSEPPPQYLLQPDGGYYFQIYGSPDGQKWCLLAWPAYRRHDYWWDNYAIPTFAYVQDNLAEECDETRLGQTFAIYDPHYAGGYAKPELDDLFLSEPFGEIDMRYWRPYSGTTPTPVDIDCRERHGEACDLYELKITLEKCAFANLFLSLAGLAGLGLRWIVQKRHGAKARSR